MDYNKKSINEALVRLESDLALLAETPMDSDQKESYEKIIAIANKARFHYNSGLSDGNFKYAVRHLKSLSLALYVFKTMILEDK